MFSNERDLEYNITDILKTPLFEDDFNSLDDARDSENALLLGSTLRTATAYGRTATVKPGEDIRPALNSLKQAGGGTLVLLRGTHRIRYTLVGFSNLRIVGEGKDLTILDFQDTGGGLQFNGTSSNPITNITLDSFSIKGAAFVSPHANIYMQQCEGVTVSNVKSSLLGDGTGEGAAWELAGVRTGEFRNCEGSSCDEGFFIRGNTTDGYTQNLQFSNCLADGNNGTAWYIQGSDNKYALLNLSFTNCRAENTTNNEGFFISGDSSPITEAHLVFVNCQASNNGSGFYTNVGMKYVTFIGCHAFDNSTIGFYMVGTDVTRISLIGCVSNGNTDRGIVTFGQHTAVIGCQSFDNGSGDTHIQISGQYSTAIGNITNALISLEEPDSVLIGNVVEQTNSLVPNTQGIRYTDTDDFALIDSNIGDSTTTYRRPLRLQNTSGSALVAGDVVILKSNSDGDQVTTTTTAGDDKVFAMALESVSNNNYGDFLVEGYTDVLKVDGTADIAIGDFLSTFTSAGIAKLASTGDMAFAIALEGYTTDDSNGVINALLIKPRKI